MSGPICTRSADDWSVAVRKIAIVARNPAIAHTPVDTIFGLMPVRREVEVGRRGAHGIAERGVAEQPPETDGDHRDRDQHEELACAHLDVEERVPGAGERQRELRLQRAGSVRREQSVIASHSCATPMVATRTITRGALNKRRITASSMSTPVRVPSTGAMASDGQYGQPCTPTITANSGGGHSHVADRRS